MFSELTGPKAVKSKRMVWYAVRAFLLPQNTSKPITYQNRANVLGLSPYKATNAVM